jgi:hypothetical protein
MLSPLILAATVIMVGGAGLDMTLSVSLAEAADDIDPVAVQALQAFWDNDFVPVAIGAELLFLSVGLSIVRYGAMPKWLGWVALVLAVVGVTPVGFVAFPLGGLWLIIVSIMLAVRANRAATPPAAGAPPAVAPPA